MFPESFPRNVFQTCNLIEAAHTRFESAGDGERSHALTELLMAAIQMESGLLAMAARPDIDIDLTGFVRWYGIMHRAHRLAAGSGELDPHADDSWPDARAALQRLRYKAGAVARGEVKPAGEAAAKAKPKGRRGRLLKADGTAGVVRPAGWIGNARLAELHDVEAEPLRKRLERWRHDNARGWMEVGATERGPNDPRFLYDAQAVQPVIEALKATVTRRTKTSGQRPAQK